MKGYCSSLDSEGRDFSTSAVTCDGASTEFLQRSLANQMFNHCGAWCVFDYEYPETISYGWNKQKKCFDVGGCKGHSEQAIVAKKKSIFCQDSELCIPVAPVLSEAVMHRYCETLQPNQQADAKGCHDSYTPYVQRSLANKMFAHCGAWCLYDFDHPETISYGWDDKQKCWLRGSGCQYHTEQKLAVARKAKFCEAELCIPVQNTVSETLMKHQCEKLSKTGEEYGPEAKSCDSADTINVLKALANGMFHHCNAWCLFDFDQPDKVAYGWNPKNTCWQKSDHCGPQVERDFAVQRKSKLCKA